MTNLSPLPTKPYDEVLIELGDEQVSGILRAVSELCDTDVNILWNQVLYHTTLMMFGYGLPVIQGGARFGALGLVA